MSRYQFKESSGRRRRSAADSGDSPVVKLSFRAHQREFNLILHADSSIFTDDYLVEDSNGHSLKHKVDHLVSGRLENEPGSHAEGQIRNGVFVGSIYSPRWGTFYVEKGANVAGVTHSVIYHENDIKLPHPPAKSSKYRILKILYFFLFIWIF